MGGKKTSPKLLACYLSLFLAVVPGISRGAIIDSGTTSPQGAKLALVQCLQEAGIDRAAARDLAEAFGQTEGEIPLPLLTGAGVQYPDQDVTAELVIVMVLMGGMLGLCVWAASASH